MATEQRVAAWLGRLVTACMLVFASPAFTQERIDTYDTAVELKTDGSVAVEETITIRAEGRDIRRGIIRDIPFVLQTPSGGRHVSAVTVETVTRNGQDEPFSVEKGSNTVEIQIGDPDRLLENGWQTYVIRYRMERVARAFDDHDEIYWNAIGTEWVFPIRNATTTVTLPIGATIRDVIGFSGPVGSRARNVRITRPTTNSVRFVAQAPLGAGEGMTVAVAIDKGVVQFPQGAAAAWQWLSDQMGMLVSLALALATGLVGFFSWLRFGRDPKPGVIFPRFYPPKGVSPASVGFIASMGQSRTEGFTATLFNLAARKLVLLEKGEEDGVLVVRRSSEPENANLAVEERAVLAGVAAQDPLVFDGKANEALANLVNASRAMVQKENRGKWFLSNNRFRLLVIAAFVALLAWALAQDEKIGETLAFLAIPLPFVFFIVIFGITMFRIRARWFPPFIIVLLFAPWIAFLMMNMEMPFWQAVIIWTVVAAAGSVILFVPLMSTLTPSGRAMLDEVEGFRMYVDTAEKDRLNMVGEPGMSVERFETILPFAIAMGLEKPWTERFQSYLRNLDKSARAAVTYGALNSSDITPAVQAASRGATRAVQALARESSSSSGSSGFSGGSSGGGSGGGGGRGW